MGSLKFIEQTDKNIKLSWSEDRFNQNYTDDESRIATVLTRQDTALNASINCYNAKTLESIKYGVWFIAVIGLIQIFLVFY